MALTPRLDLRQSQQLVMTPQLQQAIKLLQLTNMELADYVSQEVEQNPLLEMGEPSESSGPDASENGNDQSTDKSDLLMRERPDDGSASDGLVASDRSIESGTDVTSSGDSPLDTSFDENVYNNNSASDNIGDSTDGGGLSYDGAGSVRNGSGISDERSLDQTLEGDENLHDFLTRQMAVLLNEPKDRLIATHLIDLVDEAGYIPAPGLPDIAERLGAELDDVERVLSELQGLEPSGVFARNLSECIAIQLRELDRYDPAMQALVENLDLLARRDIAALKRICQVDQEDLTDMIKEIRALNPKPGLAFGSEDVQPVVPDIFVQKNRAGIWVVELNSDTLPKVLVNSQYLTRLTEVSKEKEAKAFISECTSNANWLVKALDQRARTILKVATAIVKTQNQFFEHGVRFLKPLTLKDIADDIDMHESTVSRVTNNKFMSCPRGMFELKYFFNSAISSADGGDAHSAESVKYRLKELIDAEDPKKILSDDKLVVLMKAEGIDIARRTVAKYREALRIPSSVERRRQKNMAS